MASSISSLGDEDLDLGRQRHTFAVAPDHMPPSTDPGPAAHGAASQRLLTEDGSSSQTQSNFQEKNRHQQAAGTKASLFRDWWLLELVGAMLSLGATAAIIIILAVYDGRPLPSWPYKITLNSLLSVLSTIAKTSMLFATMECIGQSKWLLFRQGAQNLADFHAIDGASRGPWDALLLLYRIKRRAMVASVGAFIVVASLAVDPLTQQVLSYPSRLNITQDYANPSLPMVSSWITPGKVSEWKSGQNSPTSVLPLSMRAAIYNSLLGLGRVNSALSLDCPTGNCTFERANTLGFCSSCNDVTNLVTKNCTNNEREESGGINCTYHLPGEIKIQVENTIIADDYDGSGMASSNSFRRTTNMSAVALPRYDILNGNALPGEDHAIVTNQKAPTKSVFQGVPAPLLGFGRIVFNGSYLPVPSTGGSIMPNATECAMFWCVQTLDTAIQNGTLSQNITQTWSNSSGFDTAGVYLQTDPSAPAYIVSEMSNLPLVKFLEDTFTSTMSGINLPGTHFTKEELFDLSIYSSDAAQALWYTEYLAGLMNNLADRMTDTLRNQFADASLYYPGDVLIERTFVSVRWPWLILPVTLVVLSCGLLLTAIISSSKHRAILWKNSSLATLFHGFTSSEDCTGHLVYKKQMELEAEHIQVRLEETAYDGLHLVDQRLRPNQNSSLGVR